MVTSADGEFIWEFLVLIQMCLVLQIVMLYFKYAFHGW
jgi:hypothetical protein